MNTHTIAYLFFIKFEVPFQLKSLPVLFSKIVSDTQKTCKGTVKRLKNQRELHETLCSFTF